MWKIISSSLLFFWPVVALAEDQTNRTTGNNGDGSIVWALIVVIFVGIGLYQYGGYIFRKFDTRVFFSKTMLQAIGLEVIFVLLMWMTVATTKTNEGGLLVITILLLAFSGLITITVKNVRSTNFLHGVIISLIQFVLAPVLAIGAIFLWSAFNQPKQKKHGS